jgi:hypothetical protein
MKRMLWLGIGLAVGALVVRAVSKKARAFPPEGIAGSVGQSASGLLDSVRNFVDDVRDGMAEREQEIHAAFAEGVTIDDEDFGDDGSASERDPQEGTR